MKKEFNILSWDSDFFGFQVGKITGVINEESDIQDVVKLLEVNKCKLSYLSSLKELPSFVLRNSAYDFVLVDRKVTYTKTIDPSLEISKFITNKHNIASREKLIDLAIQSGKYSRYNTDKRIGKEKFEELYRLWMINSLNGDLATEVLSFVSNTAVTGFVSIGERNQRADIGLIAVDSMFRGKGIGKSLMNSAEKWCANLGYKEIQVVTQVDNIPAIQLYQSRDYQVESIEFIYHIWRK